MEEHFLSYEERFGALDLVTSYEHFFQLLWYAQMPCVDIEGVTSQAKDEIGFLKQCYWKGHLVSCNSIFQKRPTDRGMCCVFNMQHAKQSLKNGMYQDSISSRQSEDAKKAFEQQHPPKWYAENNEPTTEAGTEKGLTIVVDGHYDKLSAASIQDNFRAFPILVSDKDDFPSLDGNERLARPGYETKLRVRAQHYEGLKEIRKYSPSQRKCYFPDEYELKMHRHYSKSNCIMECKMDFAAKCLTTCNQMGEKCNCKDLGKWKNMENRTLCLPWYYPSTNEDLGQICNPWNTEKFNKIMKEQVPKGHCSHCYPDCTRTKYGTTLDYAEFQNCDIPTLGGESWLCNI